jgi:hypothetical protein
MADLSRDTLDRLQQRLDDDSSGTSSTVDDTKEDTNTCPHTMLMPRWDAIEDMGKMDKVVGYRCDSCGRTLTIEEGRSALEAGAMVMGR